MIPPTPTEVLPFKADVNGVVRVGRTRITLEVLITAFTDGATAEEIAQQYSSLQLADIYSIIGYYLRHRSEVDAYLHQRTEQVAKVRKKNESRSEPSGIRDRLLARRTDQH